MVNEVQETSESQVISEQLDNILTGKKNTNLLIYNISLSFILSILLMCLISFQPSISENISKSLNTNPTQLQDSYPTPGEWIVMILTMISAGGLGGILRNLHGYYVHIGGNHKGLPKKRALIYYLRPLTGAVLGFLALFLGDLITSALAGSHQLAWKTTVSNRMSYIGIAILAGFTSQYFLGRMKEVAKTLFGETNSNGQTSKNKED